MKFISRKHFLRVLAYGGLIESIKPYKSSYRIHYAPFKLILPYLHHHKIPYIMSLTNYNLVTSDLYHEILESNPEYFI